MKVGWAFPFLIIASEAFVWPQQFLAFRSGSSKALSTALRARGSNPLVESRLSRLKINVPNVDKTVAFWETVGGSLAYVNPSNWAIVELGKDSNYYGLTLELEKMETEEKSELRMGNALGGIEICLPKLDSDEGRNTLSPGLEPNGINVISRDSSSSGESFCRVTLRTNDLESSKRFYMQLGMSVSEENGLMVCLSYKSDPDSVTDAFLVLESTDDEIDIGTYFHGLEIQTKNYYAAYEYLEEASIPIEDIIDFDLNNLFGVVDPNGYPIIVAGRYF